MPKRISKPARSLAKGDQKPARKTAEADPTPAERRPPQTAVAANLAARNDNAFPVAGFGASAGGLEAFTQVLNNLSPSTGMAFVLVQHLDPTRESMLAEILSRATSMPVIEVRSPTPVKPNHVYVAPRGQDIRIQNRVLNLTPHPATRELHLDIDCFFCSLAGDLKNKAIGVILSGTRSDGSQGLKAIKTEGGITFAQDEKTARFDGMLRSAIAGGCVDFILPPDKIAEELARLGSHLYVASFEPAPPEEVIPLAEDALAQILRRIHAATNVDLSLYKPNTIERRILRRMMLCKAESPNAYLKRLEADPAEVQALFEDMLINVTQFFRDPDTFQALKTDIFPKIAGEEDPEGVRIWVPGCSTGEEVYSLAICLLEYLEEQESEAHVQFFGSEISEHALDRARAGLYGEAIAADVSPERLKKFFVKVERGYRISKRIRECCIFARQNLTRDPPFSKLDLISCRNVLIYLGPALQKKVLPIFHYALKPTGFLLLGSSETIGAYAEMFSLADRTHKIYAKRLAPTRLPVDFAYGGPAVETKLEHDPTTHRTTLLVPADLYKEADRLVVSRYAPPGVIINEDQEVLQFRGQTGMFLEPPPGPASYNILKMAREGLAVDLRSAVRLAMSGGAAVRHEGLRIKHDGDYLEFDLEVLPLKQPPAGGRFLLVLFRPRPAVQTKPVASKSARRGKESSSAEIRTLRLELAATKERLQGIIEEQEGSNEELRSANEEIQSSNEELQSTNEELETAKEELQSSNEELNTVNEELENRNAQVAQINDDLRNLLSSVHIPIVMVSSDLRIRRFTPQAEKVFSIIASDVGRPIGNIRPNIIIPNLEQLLTEVIETLRTHEAEVQDVNGRWHLLRVRPYRTEENKIDGAVVALVDIDQMKQASEAVRLARDLNLSIIETARSSLLVLDAELRAKLANPAFYQMFELTPGEVLDQNIYDIAGGYWKFPALCALFEDLPKNGRLDDFMVEHDFPRVGHKSLVLNARWFRGNSDNQQLVLLAIDNMTGRKRE
ncbi:MAG: PAS domain-containing protein [Acidobacteriia bacterium]|nr:PAS domain-containing protein [Terriglobia bacterium]